MTDPSNKDSDSDSAKAPRPAAQGLESFRIGVRGAMKPPPSIPIVKGKPQPEQEEPVPAAPEPTAAPSPPARAAAPLTARAKTAPGTSGSTSQRPPAASSPAAPAPAPPPQPQSATPATAPVSSSQPQPAAAPASSALPPSADVSPTTLARIQKAQRALDKAQDSKRKKSPRTGSSREMPLKRPWSKLQSLASKKQKAGARPSQEEPSPPRPVGPRKKRTP